MNNSNMPATMKKKTPMGDMKASMRDKMRAMMTPKKPKVATPQKTQSQLSSMMQQID